MFALLIGVSSFVLTGQTCAFAQEGPAAEAGAEGESGAGATGTGTSEASQETGTGAEAEVTPTGDANATGEAETQAQSQESSQSTAAETGASAEASAQKSGEVFSAESNATATYEATDGTGTTPPATITADTSAVFDPNDNKNIVAQAQTTQNNIVTTEAQSVYGVSAKANCAGGCSQKVEKVGLDETVAAAMAGNSVSMAVTTRDRAFAKAGVFSDFSLADVSYGGQAFVDAWSEATRSFAEAFADASSRASGRVTSQSQAHGGAGDSESWASSRANAKACVGKCGSANAKQNAKTFEQNNGFKPLGISNTHGEWKWVKVTGKIFPKLVFIKAGVND